MYPDGCAPITSDFAPDATSSLTYETSLQVPKISCCADFACSVSAEVCQAKPSTPTTTRRIARFIAPVSSQPAMPSEFPSIAAGPGQQSAEDNSNQRSVIRKRE